MTISDKDRLAATRTLVEDYPELIDNQHIPLVRLTLWVILAGSIVLVVSLSIALDKEYLWRTYIPAAVAALAIIGHAVLRYRGVVAAVRFLVAGGWLAATAGAFLAEGLRTPVLLVYPTLVIFAGWMLGARSGIALYIASSIAVVAMAIGQSMGAIADRVPFPIATMALAHLMVLTIGIGLTLYLGRSFHRSYERYRLLTENIGDVIWILDVATMQFRYVSPSVQRLLGYTPEDLLIAPLTPSLTTESGERVIDLIRTRAGNFSASEETAGRFYRDIVEQKCKDGSLVWTEEVTSYYRNPENGRVKVRGVTRDITERKQAERDFWRFRAAMDATEDGIYLVDHASMRFVDINAGACKMLGLTRDEIFAAGPEGVLSISREELARIYDEVIASGVVTAPVERLRTRQDGKQAWVEIRRHAKRIGEQWMIVTVARDITERKQSEERLEKAHREMLDLSRLAGMAEVATSVLHNVGNVLNSVNASAEVVSSTLRSSRARGLTQAIRLMDEHSADLGNFLALDEKGRLLPGYLNGASQALAQEQQQMIAELSRLTQSVDHIKSVVASQQSYARGSGMIEPVQICELAEDALRMSGDSLARYQVTVVREFAPVPLVRLDRARLLQILVNLISNAKNAMEAMPDASRRLTLRVDQAGGSRLRIQVQDEGEGIAAQNLTRIFVHGFTTRKDGHGFGLHSCALAARQMGGTLTAHSDGPGRGATFTLELPMDTGAARESRIEPQLAGATP